MKFQIVQPAGFLKNYIRNYSLMESDVHEGNVMERVIPIENVQLMFHYKNPFIVYHPDNTVARQPRSMILLHSVLANGIEKTMFIALGVVKRHVRFILSFFYNFCLTG